MDRLERGSHCTFVPVNRRVFTSFHLTDKTLHGFSDDLFRANFLPPPPSAANADPSGGWNIYTRREITDRYEVLDGVGSGTYSDVYRGRRLADGLIVALKEVHDYQSAYREIEALQVLKCSPNVITLLDYFWRDDDNDDAVLVLEFLDTDLASVISDAERNRDGGIRSGEVKRWMLQILQEVDACHRNSTVHRDLTPANLLVSAGGVLKVADFGQSRTLLPDPTFCPEDDRQNCSPMLQQQRPLCSWLEGSERQIVAQPEPGIGLKQSYLEEDTGEEAENIQDGNASCLATCTTSDMALRMRWMRTEKGILGPSLPVLAHAGFERRSCSTGLRSMGQRLICGHWDAFFQSLYSRDLPTLINSVEL